MENETMASELPEVTDEFIQVAHSAFVDALKGCSEDELMHYGVRGMKWGVRRTPAQLGHKPASKKMRQKAKKFVDKLKAQYQAKKAAEAERKKDLEERNKPISKMSDAELRDHLNRVRMEREAYMIDRDIQALNPKKVSAGQKFANDFKERALGPAAIEAGKKLLSGLMDKAVRKALGDEGPSALEKAAKEAQLQDTINRAKTSAAIAIQNEIKAKKAADDYAASKKTPKQPDPDPYVPPNRNPSPYSRSSSDLYGRGIDVVNSSANKSTSAVVNNTTYQLGQRAVAGYLSAPIAGYLPAPKDDD